jgi:hypothetical protein
MNKINWQMSTLFSIRGCHARVWNYTTRCLSHTIIKNGPMKWLIKFDYQSRIQVFCNFNK